jgi:hypothetical protein
LIISYADDYLELVHAIKSYVGTLLKMFLIAKWMIKLLREIIAVIPYCRWKIGADEGPIWVNGVFGGTQREGGTMLKKSS